MKKVEELNGRAIYTDGKHYYVGTSAGEHLQPKRDLTAAVLALHGIKYNIDTVAAIMDEVDISEFGLAECRICGETCEIGDMCTEHGDDEICKNCCEECRREQARGEYYDRQVDEFRHGY